MMEQSSREGKLGSRAIGEIAEGIQGLITKRLTTENHKGIVLSREGFSFIDRNK